MTSATAEKPPTGVDKRLGFSFLFGQRRSAPSREFVREQKCMERLLRNGLGASKMPRRPLIAVVGSTGTGKSQLAVEIAQRFDGEIINGDAMQLYAGLPIITNKIREDEQNGIPHHLLGVVGLNEQTWTVEQFVSRATTAIEEIRQRGRLPILVGGTHYYTQSLLFNDRITRQDKKETFESNSADKWPILKESNSVILERLREVDPVIAERWHPNDRRKIRRSLEIFFQTGKPASQVYAKQRERRRRGSIDEPLSDDARSDRDPEEPGLMRYDALVLWVHAQKEVLWSRLKSRVDRMAQDGILEEVRAMEKVLSEKQTAGESIDQTRGIWVSIGYKEFESYQQLLRDPSSTTAQRENAKREALELVNIATRQYAVRQVKWIRTKLVHAFKNALLPNRIFLLDGTNLDQWKQDVQDPAMEITEKFLSQSELPDAKALSPAAAEMLQSKTEYDMSDRQDLWRKQTCTCGVITTTEKEWQDHIKSKSHKRAMKHKARVAFRSMQAREASPTSERPNALDHN